MQAGPLSAPLRRLQNTATSLQRAATTTTMAPVRWGILGSGLICSDFVQALRSCEGAHVTAVGARSPEKARAFAEANAIPSSYGSYEELVADPEVDIVYVGTVHTMHKRHALMALRAGKAVLCEKPMTCAKADTEELIRVATEQGVLLCEAMWTRFFPTVRHARQLLASGDIGQVLQMHGDFGFRFPDVDTNTTHRLTDPALAGGATLDIGVYPIACMLLAFGAAPPRKVAVAGQLHASGVDKTVGVTATWDDGKVAHMTWTIEAQTPEEWRIIGSEGMMVFDAPAHAPLELRVIKPGGDRASAPNTELITPPQPTLLPEANPLNFPGSEGFLYQAQALTAAFQAGLTECPEFTHAESVAMASLCDEILRQMNVVYPPSVYE